MRSFAKVALGLAAAVLLTATSASAFALEPVKLDRQEAHLGTSVTLTAWAVDEATAAAALQAGFDEVRRVESVFSAYRQGSAVSQLNQYAGRRPVTVSDEVLRVLAWARQISELTDGAFDVTVGGFEWVYGFGQGDYRVPNAGRLDALRRLVNYKYVMLFPEDRTVVFKRDGVQIDLGGIAKTHALNTVREVLARSGVAAALVNLGGDVTVVGDRPGGAPWQVGIRHPRDPQRLLTVVPLVRGKLLTSGDYERSFVENETRYHHILDAHTGRPVMFSIAATLSLPERPGTDLPSVVLMLVPPEQALKWVAAIPGAECLIVDREGKVWLSPGWQGKLQIVR